MRRGITLGVALVLHVALGLLLLRATDSTLRFRPSELTEVVHVELLAKPSNSLVTLPPAAPPLLEKVQRRRNQLVPDMPRIVATSPRTISTPQTVKTSIAMILPVPATSVHPPSDLDEALQRKIKYLTTGKGLELRVPPLPGKSHYKYQFLFIDSNARGLKGALKFISGLTVQPNCIESRAHLHPNTVDPLVISEDKRATECVRPDGSVEQ